MTIVTNDLVPVVPKASAYSSYIGGIKDKDKDKDKNKAV